MSRPSSSWLVRTIACAALVGVGLAVACSVDVDLANKACPCGSGYVCDTARSLCVLPQDLPQTCDACPCTIDADCKDPTRAHCSPAKICVECAPSPDTCAVGYCNDKFQCTAGCKTENECQKISPGTHCQLALHQCVECVLPNYPCKDSTKACSPSGSCTESCTTTCANGKACCKNFCLDTKSDVLICGACYNACMAMNGSPACVGGACSPTCASGFAHCDATNVGCETNIRTDINHCGSCATSCKSVNATGGACNAGACTYTSCLDGFADCDGNKANGCECACGDKGQVCCPTGPACQRGNCNGGRCP